MAADSSISTPHSASSDSGAPSGELIIAIDTGGTKTAAWLAESLDFDSFKIIGHARTSAGNPLSVGFDESARAIGDAILQVCQTHGTTSVTADRAVLSIAGAANHDMAQRFVAWAQSLKFARQVAIVSDVLPILAAGTPDCCGVALISGTGSSAFGRNADGRAKRCGGWGYLLGDEGSGYAIGREALRHTLTNIENGSNHNLLAESVREKLEVKTVTDLTRTIYGGKDSRHAIASLAILVASAADNGDAEAAAILDSAAKELAHLAARTARAVGIKNAGFPLAASGGLLMNSLQMQRVLLAELSTAGLECALTVVSEPLAGCVRLANPKYACDLVAWHPA